MIELKAFTASTSETASVDSSLKIFSTVCIAASNPASYPAHTCSDPADEIPSFLIADAMTFPVIWRRVSSTPTGRKPGFLTRGMSRHATNASMETVDTSSVQIVLIKYAIVLQDLRLYRQTYLNIESFSTYLRPFLKVQILLLFWWQLISSLIPTNIIW